MYKRTLAALRFRLTKLYVHYLVRVDPKAKCPACGHRRAHPVVFSPVQQKLLHQCEFCKAAWAEPPLVQAGVWSLPVAKEPEPDTPRVPFGAQREPVRTGAK